MKHETSIEIFRKYFENQLAQAKNAMEKSKHYNRPFISISRLTGAGGVNFTEKLVNHLNGKDEKDENSWMFFDKDILEIVLEEHNLPKEISKYMPEGKMSEIQDVIEQLFGLHQSEHRLITKISDTILHLSNLGNVVLVGRGSNIITNFNKNGLHLRLIDSLDNRLIHIQNYFKLSKVEALKLIQKEDKGRAAYIKKFFNKDINSPDLYSLIINFDLIKVGDAIELIRNEITKIRNRINE